MLCIYCQRELDNKLYSCPVCQRSLLDFADQILSARKDLLEQNISQEHFQEIIEYAYTYFRNQYIQIASAFHPYSELKIPSLNKIWDKFEKILLSISDELVLLSENPYEDDIHFSNISIFTEKVKNLKKEIKTHLIKLDQNESELLEDLQFVIEGRKMFGEEFRP